MFAALKEKKSGQPEIFAQIPIWWWLLAGVIVIAIAIVWFLREEESETVKRRTSPAKVPKPPKTVADSARATPTAQQATPSPVAQTEAATAHVAPTKADNLKQITGIGPKIQQVLNQQGIYTFEQLAATPASSLEQIIKEQGWHMANYTNWPAQAKQLAQKSN